MEDSIMGQAVTKRSVITLFLKIANEAAIRNAKICIMNHLFWRCFNPLELLCISLNSVTAGEPF